MTDVQPTDDPGDRILNAPVATPRPLASTEQQQAALQAAIVSWVKAGYTVESMLPPQAVLSRKRRIGFFWNTVLAILTGGLWLLWVLYRVINRKTDRVVLMVDPYGQVVRA